MFKSSAVFGLALCGALVPLSAAYATASGSATLGALQIQLTDLNTSDGIAPSYTVSEATTTFHQEVGFDEHGDNITKDQPVPGWWMAGSQSASMTGASASSSIDSNGMYATGSVSANVGDLYSKISYSVARTTAYYTLAPYTQITFTAPYHAEESVDPFHCNTPSLCNLETFGAGVAVTYGSATNGIGQTFAEVSADNTVPGHDKPLVKDGVFTFTITNNTDKAVLNSVDLMVSASGNTVLAVPEPATASLMLAALASLGWVARRRKA